jgi:hypothetical protein
MSPTGRNRRGRALAAFVVAGAFLIAAGRGLAGIETQRWGYTTDDFEARKTRPLRVAILQPHADFIKEKMIISDQMVAESMSLENEAAGAIKSVLEEKGYAVRVVAPADLQQSAPLRTLVVKANDRYGEEWSKILYRPGRVPERLYSVGDAAIRLCSLLEVDGLVLVRIQAVGVSKGKATMRAIFLSSRPTSYARLDLAVIDGRTGAVEGFFSGFEPTSLGQITKKPALVMGQVVDNAIRGYPTAEMVRTFKKRKATSVESASTDDRRLDADDPVQDFEILLQQRKK